MTLFRWVRKNPQRLSRLIHGFCNSRNPNPNPEPKTIFGRAMSWKRRYFLPPSVTRGDIITDSIIRRQLINDALQIPLKALACYLLPAALRGPFMAEFMRSVIDGVNHSSIWFVNSVNFGPSSRYPYGLEKIKNILSHSVAMLFAISGLYNFRESYLLFTSSGEFVSHGGGMSTTLLYFLGIAIECFVIYLNIKGTQEMKGTQTSLFSNWAEGIQDPLLKVILTENLLTLTSMAIPLACQGITTWIWPSNIVTASGVLLMGIIQVYLSIHLYMHNIRILAGDMSIEQAKIEKISEIIKNTEFVVSLNSIIGVMVDSEHFRLSLDITVDHNALIDQTSEMFEDMIEEASNIDDIVARKQFTLEIATEAHLNALSQARHGEDEIRRQIQKQFPECTNIQISFRLDEVPITPYPIFQNLQAQEYRGVSRDPQLSLFLDTFLNKSKKVLQKQQPIDRGEYMSNEISKEAVDQLIYLQEEIRFKMLSDSLKQFASNNKN